MPDSKRPALRLCDLLASATLIACAVCLRSEVNVTRPKEYWDYESIAVQWGWVYFLRRGTFRRSSWGELLCFDVSSSPLVALARVHDSDRNVVQGSRGL